MLHILPQGLGDDRPRLGVNPEQTRQSRVQLELGRLVVQQQQDRTAHAAVSRPLHLLEEVVVVEETRHTWCRLFRPDMCFMFVMNIWGVYFLHLIIS